MQTPRNVTVNEAFDIGVQHLQAGNLMVADRTFRDILTVMPDYYPARHMLGLTCYHRGQIGEAIAALAEAARRAPDDAEILNHYGIMLSEGGRLADALAQYDASIAIAPDYPDVHSNRANTLWQMDRFEDAEQSARRAIELRPDYADAYLNLGNALVPQGRAEDAIAAWHRALEINPGFSQSWSNIGNALRDLGRLSEAEDACRKALEIDDNNAQGWCNLGNAVRDLGRSAEAETHYRRATAIKPDYAVAHHNLAIALIDQMKLADAAVAAKYAVTFDPNYAEAWSCMSLALRELGRVKEAENAARNAVTLRPDSAEAHIDLGDVMLMAERFEEAELALSESLRLQPDSTRVYLKLAAAQERANRIDDALESIDKAIALSPEMPDPHYRKAAILFLQNNLDGVRDSVNRALALKPDFSSGMAMQAEIALSLGDESGATESIRRAIAMDPHIPSHYMTLVKLKKFTDPADPDLAAMLDLEKNAAQFGQQQETSLCFALFKAFEDLKDYDRAFDYLQRGNAIKRKTVYYNADESAAQLADIKRVMSPAIIQSIRDTGYHSDLPVFIVGMPRSGTTLTEQIISAHPDVYGAGELHDFTLAEQLSGGRISAENAKKIGEIYIDRIRKLDKAGRAKRITDKMPGNFSRIGMIAAALPDAKIIHCRRDPVDTCLSCYKQLFARGQYWSYDLEELGHYHQSYLDIMQYWRDTLPGRFIEIDYADTVNDLEGTARRLIDYIGLPWNDACLAPHKNKRAVITASKAQVIRPVYKTALESWRKYESRIQPLINIVAPDRVSS